MEKMSVLSYWYRSHWPTKAHTKKIHVFVIFECVGHLGIYMCQFWVKRGPEMIGSHRAPSSLNMCSCRAIPWLFSHILFYFFSFSIYSRNLGWHFGCARIAVCWEICMGNDLGWHFGCTEITMFWETCNRQWYDLEEGIPLGECVPLIRMLTCTSSRYLSVRLT